MSQLGNFSVLFKYGLLSLLAVTVVACSNLPLPKPGTTEEESIDELEPALVNRLWELSGYRNSAGIASSFTNKRGHKFTINFGFFETSDGSIVRQVSGIEGCNNYGGSFALDQNVLLLSDVTATVVGCQIVNKQPGILFNRILNDSPKIFLQGDRMQIRSEGKESLVFTDGTKSI